MRTAYRSMIVLAMLSQFANAGTRHREVDLRKNWRFQIGNDSEYASPEYNDSDWERIRVPGNWERQGYPDYDGFAWYRTKFNVSKDLKEKVLVLDLGVIDDVDRVFLNGRRIGGKGQFPPQYISAYNQSRRYLIPNDLLLYGKENVLAVQVYDDWGDGGFVSGRIGIDSEPGWRSTVDLTGEWKFTTGDDTAWADPKFNDSDWDDIIVPAQWETQGFQDYDGYAWYRINTLIPSQLSDEKLIMVIGAIDDIDEVYLNGVHIGRTGYFPAERYGKANEKFWNRERHYSIPSNLIHWGKDNLIAVRVYDVWGEGGIYQGPVGIITQKEFTRYWRKHNTNDWRNENDVFDEIGNFFDDIF